MKQADIDSLKNQIKNEFDIDLDEYRNEEVVSSFVEMLIFPKYVFKWVVRPVIFAVLLYIVGFFVLQFGSLDLLFYIVIGLILFVLAGIFAGLLFLTYKIREDMWGVIEYSFDILKRAIDDLGEVSQKLTGGNKKGNLGLLFKGVVQVVTIPLLTKVVKDKIPFLGGPVAGVINRVLNLVSSKVEFKEDDIPNEDTTVQTMGSKPSSRLVSISNVSNGVENVLEKTFKVVQFPLKLAVIVFVLVLGIFLYLVN